MRVDEQSSTPVRCRFAANSAAPLQTRHEKCSSAGQFDAMHRIYRPGVGCKHPQDTVSRDTTVCYLCDCNLAKLCLTAGRPCSHAVVPGTIGACGASSDLAFVIEPWFGRSHSFYFLRLLLPCLILPCCLRVGVVLLKVVADRPPHFCVLFRKPAGRGSSDGAPVHEHPTDGSRTTKLG